MASKAWRGFSSIKNWFSSSFSSMNNKIDKEVFTWKDDINITSIKNNIEIQVLKKSIDFYSKTTLVVGALSISNKPKALFQNNKENIQKEYLERRWSKKSHFKTCLSSKGLFNGYST